MNEKQKQIITVQCTVNDHFKNTWKYWTNPADVMQWNFATSDWHCLRHLTT